VTYPHEAVYTSIVFAIPCVPHVPMVFCRPVLKLGSVHPEVVYGCVHFKLRRIDQPKNKGKMATPIIKWPHKHISGTLLPENSTPPSVTPSAGGAVGINQAFAQGRMVFVQKVTPGATDTATRLMKTLDLDVCVQTIRITLKKEWSVMSQVCNKALQVTWAKFKDYGYNDSNVKWGTSL
jgi:hypothetical protein